MKPLDQIVNELRHAFQTGNISQESAAKACHLNQSQVSRLLDGKCKRISKGMQKLCIYASVNIQEEESYEPTTDVDLMRALRMAIGNSAARARQIERVVRALGDA